MGKGAFLLMHLQVRGHKADAALLWFSQLRDALTIAALPEAPLEEPNVPGGWRRALISALG